MFFRGKKFAVRLVLVLLVTLVVVVIQIISVSRISSPTPYPWELPLDDRRDIGRDLRAVPTLNSAVTSLTTHDSHQELSNQQNNSSPVSHQSTFSSSSSSSPATPITFCYITSKDAVSAIERAKTEDCKNMIRSVTCQSQANKLYDTEIKNICPIGRNPAQQFKHVPYENGKGPLPRVVFLLSVHGRAIRQVQRLFKAIYHSDHFYYIHIDARSDYLYREIVKMISDYPNVHIPDWQLSTIWGGASLLKMLLRSLEDLEYKLTHWKWDFFINLSESDFPLKNNDELVQFLRVHRHSNFVKTHGGDINKFIQKQGLDRTFVECDNHMWRIGNRHLPPDITVDGGSDWIAINRNYSRYLVKNTDRYLKGLKKYYEYSLLPAESFFHTVLRNGPLCHTLVRTNLRVTNWNRKLGCRCQYKHIVDWCGCSPNDFLPKDITRLKSPGDHHFFARKFEAIVNQQIVNELSVHLFGDYPDGTPSLSSYWQNTYHVDDKLTIPSSAHFTLYNSFLRQSLKLMSKKSNESNCHLPVNDPASVREVHVYYHEDHFSGFLVKFQGATGPVFESYVVSIPMLEVHDIPSSSKEFAKRITSLEVGSDWDGKESIFRNYGGILGVHDHPVVALRLTIGRMGHVKTVWENPIGKVVENHDVKLDPSMTVTFHKPNFENPIMPGIWKVWIEVDSHVYMSQRFLVTPISYNKNLLLDNPVVVNGRRLDLAKSDIIDSEKYAKWRNNVIKTGKDLSDWIDELAESFWSIKDICSSTSCTSIRSCDESSWSTFYPDPKSELGPVQTNGLIN